MTRWDRYEEHSVEAANKDDKMSGSSSSSWLPTLFFLLMEDALNWNEGASCPFVEKRPSL